VCVCAYRVHQVGQSGLSSDGAVRTFVHGKHISKVESKQHTHTH